MSRIHDALKKAELDRASTLVATDTAAPPISAPAVKLESRPNGATTAPASAVTASAPAPEKALRFEDLQARCVHAVWRPEASTNVFDATIGAHGAEQFRTLRSRLYQLRNNQPLRIILVTSAIAGEGKTFVASNLARAIVRQPGRRVLLIDADLRGSHLHVPLGAPAAPGLSDYLHGAAEDTAAMQFGEDPNLCFIAGGNVAANPSELLSNGRLKILLDRFSSLFDWIIIDSPPFLPLADAGVLAEFCDGLLLVVRANSTPAAVVQKAGQELHGRNVIGVVLNAVDEQALAYGSYYWPGRYDLDDDRPAVGNSAQPLEAR